MRINQFSKACNIITLWAITLWAQIPYFLDSIYKIEILDTKPA